MGKLAKKGISNQRWIVGGKTVCVGQPFGADCGTGIVPQPMFYDGSRFQHIVDNVSHQMVAFADEGFAKVDWHPSNLRICPRGQWNDRMLIETILSMLTPVCHLKKVAHRCWVYFKTRLAFTMALFNLLVQWGRFAK